MHGAGRRTGATLSRRNGTSISQPNSGGEVLGASRYSGNPCSRADESTGVSVRTHDSVDLGPGS